MPNQTLLLSAIFIPIIGAFVLPVAAHFSRRLRNALSLIFITSSFVLSLLMIPAVMSGKVIVVATEVMPFGFNFSFAADGLAVFMACVSSLVSSIIVFYSFGYISHYEHQSEYYLMVTLFLGSMIGLVFSANLIFLYIFWEITALCSWRLIGFFREKQYVLKADKAFLMTFFGAVSMLIGFILIALQTGSFELSIIKEAFRNNPIDSLIVGLILAGILSKSATLPFQTWLPDAGVAPSPVTALLHAAVLVKIGVYVYARLFVATLDIPYIWHTIVPLIAGASALIAAGCAIIETDLKRIIAYSTISQIGFIFLGLSLNIEIGIVGGLLYILMHGLAKAGLFLCAGIIEQNTKTKDITKMGGLIKSMPLTAVAFLFCSFSVMGIPPFGGFFSKYMVFAAAMDNGNLWITSIFLLGAFMTIIYLFRVFNMVFMGTPNTLPVKEGSPTMVFSVMSLGVLSLLGGILIYYPFKFAEVAVSGFIR
ncbi:MAG: NADH-quinone oxidoreductase subunit L [Candidatus Omnitrophota bacterium]|jgi:NADH:ubiquinone oxidoreductase subunit 5 (subunit L)/multisubunit Na+/H+ antiporter MnhA subunit